MKPIIRKATLEDVHAVAQLFDAYRVFYKKESDVTAATNFLTDRLTQKDSELLVCDAGDNKLVGFVQLYPLFSSTRMQRLWLLNDLFVDPNYRGKGLSVQLINAAKDLTKTTNACGLMLETGKSNKIGNNLYVKTGFELNQSCNFYEWSAV